MSAHLPRGWIACGLVPLLISCGGGKPDSASSQTRSLARAQAAAPSQARWSALRTLPLVPVSAALMPNGRVLMWSAEEKFSFGAATGRTYSLTYDPAANSVSERTVTETAHNMFCTGTTNLADGRLFINGGISAANTSIFDPVTSAWTTGPAMNIPRGYQANTLTQDGSVLTLGGSWSGGVGNKHGEIWTAGGGWRRLTGVPIDPFLSPDPSRNFGGDSHFWLIPAGNGKVFHPGPGVNMHWIDTNGNGRVIDAGVRGDDQFSVSGNTVMYDAGKILKTGGGPGYDSVNANANSYVIDISAGATVRKLAPMAYRRAFHNSVVLPNGQVVIIGGQTYAVGFSDNNSVLVPELWDPASETFTALAPIAAPRNYHSVALLLPDARVLSAGGGLCGAGCAANHPDLQILTPHYLLNPDGTAATRPVITSAPAAMQYGQSVQVFTNTPVAAFSIVRVSSTTHTVNNDQRRLALSFRANGGNSYQVDMPTNPGWALPGDWMLFAMSADGVPSVAKIVRISRSGAATIAPIDDQSATAGSPVAAVQPSVTLPGGVVATYAASGLPSGLFIDAGTGRISGTPTQAGRYPVSVLAASGGVTVSTDFVWNVESPGALMQGLKGEYVLGRTFGVAPVRTVTEAVDFNWGTGAPGAGVSVDNFAVRWSGWLLPTVSGNHTLQTQSDDGVRVWVNDVLVIDNWTDHAATLNNSAALALTAGVRVPIKVEFYEAGGEAVMSLRWATPGNASFTPIGLANLRSSSALPNQVPVISAPAVPVTYQGQAVSVGVSASDPDGDTLRFSAAGLPTGLALNANTGVIGGIPTAPGVFDVTVGVDDGRGGSAVTRFNWSVADAVPVIQPVATAAISAGGSITYTASTDTIGSYSYHWDFGDGSSQDWSTAPSATHSYAAAGVYFVTVTVRTSDGRTSARSFWQAVQGTTGQGGRSSSPILFEARANAAARVWAVNPDNDSVSVFDAAMRTRLAEIAVGSAPRTLAQAPDGRVWVVNKGAATISVISPSSLTVVQTIALSRASQPFGIVMAADGSAYVAQEATGNITRIAANGTPGASVNVGANVRHLALDAAGTQLYAARFITPTLPGEATASVQPSATRGGELLVLDAGSLTVQRIIILQHSEKADNTIQARGIPNYLGAPVIAPDGASAWVPSKQDNIKRGKLRDGLDLTFESTVRAISSRIDLDAQAEDATARIDHDNSGVASAALFHPSGTYMFVALEASRHVAVVDAIGKRELFRVDVGRAPQGLAVSADGLTLYVQNFMDRTVSVLDLTRLIGFGESLLPVVATMASVGTERLSAQVLRGKQFFYDARDVRMSRDAYISCASCHNDGGHDGRTWDFTGFGEGLRNTISLRGRAGAQGRLHWSANFDEVQDFEGQIRNLAQGTGLMTNAQFNTGTRSQPLGDSKTGVSGDLDALAAYVASLSSFDLSPYRNADGSLTATAASGRTVFAAQCATCHGGNDFTDSASGALRNIGTVKPASGNRLGAALTGIDTPTLRDAWASAPYLHDSSAATIEDAVRAHNTFSLSSADVTSVSEFVRQIGREEAAVAPPSTTGSGLRGEYFGNVSLSGTPSLTRIQAVDFDWGTASPGAPIAANNFSVRWSGTVRAATTGTYRFQTRSDDGVRLYVNGNLVINNWTDHGPTNNSSTSISLTAGQRYAIRMEYYERSGGAVARLRWLTPGSLSYVAIPASALYAP